MSSTICQPLTTVAELQINLKRLYGSIRGGIQDGNEVRKDVTQGRKGHWMKVYRRR